MPRSRQGRRFSAATVQQFEYLAGALIGQDYVVRKVGRFRKAGWTDAPAAIIRAYARRLHMDVTIGAV